MTLTWVERIGKLKPTVDIQHVKYDDVVWLLRNKTSCFRWARFRETRIVSFSASISLHQVSVVSITTTTITLQTNLLDAAARTLSLSQTFSFISSPVGNRS